MKEERYSDKLIYKTEDFEPKAIDATIGVKFSNDIVLLKSFLDQQNIEYKMEDLEDTGLGLGIRIKRDPK